MYHLRHHGCTWIIDFVYLSGLCVKYTGAACMYLFWARQIKRKKIFLVYLTVGVVDYVDDSVRFLCEFGCSRSNSIKCLALLFKIAILILLALIPVKFCAGLNAMLWNNEFGSGSCSWFALFVNIHQDANPPNFFSLFFCSLVFGGTFTSFF